MSDLILISRLRADFVVELARNPDKVLVCVPGRFLAVAQRLAAAEGLCYGRRDRQRLAAAVAAWTASGRPAGAMLDVGELAVEVRPESRSSRNLAGGLRRRRRRPAGLSPDKERPMATKKGQKKGGRKGK